MHNLVVLIYLLFLSASLLAQQNSGIYEDEVIQCLGVLANGQNPTTLVIAFFGLIVALKFGADPAKKALDKAKKYIRTRHAV